MGKDGAGAAALVAVGAVCGVLALVGRWPSRISVSGNGLSWPEVKETVDSQIEVAEESGEANDALRELKELRERLDFLQRTGSVAVHPAEAYDRSVEAALRRLFPNAEVIRHAEVIRQSARSREVADFVVRYHGDELSVETKWRTDRAQPFSGTTLPCLMRNLPTGAKLLVVVSTGKLLPSATQIIEDTLGKRGRIVTWRDVRDDAALGEAVMSLLRTGRR